MATLHEVLEKVAKIEVAVENALENEGADAVRQAVIDAAKKYVYDAYPDPMFHSRRYGNGGILDPHSVVIEVHGTELIAKDDPDWQQLWGGSGTGTGSWRPAKRLSEAIASGDRRYNMHNAGPRPFHEHAKEEVIASGALEEALRRGLARQGFDASDATFRFT